MNRKECDMKDNYPPGAANDTRAPYNERPTEEVEVTAKSVLIKETVVETSERHTVVEREIEPDGSYSTIAYEEPEIDLRDAFESEQRRPIQIIRDCQKICQELVRVGNVWFAKKYIPKLIDDCEDWEEETFDISE